MLVVPASPHGPSSSAFRLQEGWTELLPSRRPAQLQTQQCPGPAGHTALPAHAPSLSLCGHQNEALKMVFLESICTICRGDDNTGLCDRVALFCRENNLAEKVKVRGQ